MHYNWEKAPSWALWAARDSNGFAHWFETLPYPSFSEFGVEWLSAKDTKHSGNCDPFWFDALHCPEAKVSLEARPTNLHFEATKTNIKNISDFLKKKEVRHNASTVLNQYLQLTDKMYRISHKLPLDPLEPFLGKQILVERPNDSVMVSIFRYKASGRYAFINLTKNHICTCAFNSIIEAFNDLEEQKKLGNVLNYKFIK